MRYLYSGGNGYGKIQCLKIRNNWFSNSITKLHSPKDSQPKVEKRSKLYEKIYFLLMKYYNNGKTWVGPHLHKIGEGFVEIWWNDRPGNMPRVYIRVKEGF